MPQSLSLLALPGDGIGPEITDATLEVLERANQSFGLELSIAHDVVGFASLKKHGHTVPDALLNRARQADGIILGPCDTYGYPPPAEGGVNPSSKFRTTFELYANMRPSRAVTGVRCHAPGMDLLIARENTEGFLRRSQHVRRRRRIHAQPRYRVGGAQDLGRLLGTNRAGRLRGGHEAAA